MIKNLVPYLKLMADMMICYFILLWLMFFSGIFHYPESQKWGLDIIFMSLISGIAVVVVSHISMNLVNALMNNDPNNGGYLLLTIAVSVLVVTLFGVYISQKILHFYILMTPNLVGVFMFIIYPAVFLTLMSRANKHL